MPTRPAKTNAPPCLQEVPALRSVRGRAGILPQDRYPRLVRCAAASLARLRRLEVLVTGTGSIGGRIALHLARLGVRRLTLVDPKRYKDLSLLTHEVAPESIGEPKALEIGERCKAISPTTDVFALVGPVEALDWAELADVDVVIMAPDLLAVEVELAQRCRHLGRPLMQASVHGETLTAQVRFYGNREPNGPCAACFLGADEWRLLSRQSRFSCEGVGAGSTSIPSAVPALPAAPVTNSFSGLCASAADLAINQTLRYVLGLGEPVTDTLLEYCGYTNRTVVSRLTRKPSCPIDHFTYRRVALGAPLGQLSLAGLAQAALQCPVKEDTVFEIGGMDWVERGACHCPQPSPVRRFLPRRGGKPLCCSRCASPILPLEFYSQSKVSASVLGSALEKPLRALGAGHARLVLVRSAEAGALVRHQPAESSQA